MKQSFCALGAVVSAVAISSAASAGVPFGVGDPIIVPADNTTVTVTFEFSEAEYMGKLYFSGTGNLGGLLDPAPNTNSTNQGQMLFNNHVTPIGTTRELQGTFHAGDVLHFTYDILAPSNALTDVLRTVVVNDREQFAWDPQEPVLAVEDTYIDDPNSDHDYNDIIVSVHFSSVPAPGALALLASAGLLAGGRRRR